MKHPFIKSLIDSSVCALCKRDEALHSNQASCESCESVGEVEIFGKLDNPRAMALCEKCTQKEIDANTVVLAQTQLNVIEESRRIDNSIRYNGDFFNAETISLADLKKSIDEDATISNKNEALQRVIIERIENYKTKIFQLDEEKLELVARQQASIKSLRDFGQELRNDIRERIKSADATYTPSPIIKQIKMVAPKKSPMERLVEAYMLLKGVSETDAKEAIAKGKI